MKKRVQNGELDGPKWDNFAFTQRMRTLCTPSAVLHDTAGRKNCDPGSRPSNLEHHIANAPRVVASSGELATSSNKFMKKVNFPCTAVGYWSVRQCSRNDLILYFLEEKNKQNWENYICIHGKQFSSVYLFSQKPLKTWWLINGSKYSEGFYTVLFPVGCKYGMRIRTPFNVCCQI